MVTMLLGNNCGSDCDPCCPCPIICSDGSCAPDFTLTLTGATNLVGTCCTDLNIAAALTYSPLDTLTAAQFDSFALCGAHAAKVGSQVCTYLSSDLAECVDGLDRADVQVNTAYLYRSNVDDLPYLYFQVGVDDFFGGDIWADMYYQNYLFDPLVNCATFSDTGTWDSAKADCGYSVPGAVAAAPSFCNSITGWQLETVV